MNETRWLSSDDPGEMLNHVRDKMSSRKLRLFACATWRLHHAPLRQELIDAAEEWADGVIDREVAICRVASMAPAEPHHTLFQPAAERAAGNAIVNCRARAACAALLRDVVGNPFRPVSLPVASRGGLCAACARGRHDHCGAQVSTSGIRCGCQVCWGAARCPWLTPQVLSLARAAYEDRPGRKCEHCGGLGEFEADEFQPGGCCPMCRGTGRIDDGSLDPLALLALADALEEAGCVGEKCGGCKGAGGHWRCPNCHGEWRGDVGPDCFVCGHPRLDRHGCHSCAGNGRLPHPLLAHLRSPGPHVRGCWVLDLILGKE
jgi:hypothetical protein